MSGYNRAYYSTRDHVLAKEKLVKHTNEFLATIVRFEEKVGIIRVGIGYSKGNPDWITMDQPLPLLGGSLKMLR
jgi:hypothetical protein